MIEAISGAITAVLGWAGDVVTALVTEGGDLHALLPLFAISCAVSAVLLGCRIIKGFVWGA